MLTKTSLIVFIIFLGQLEYIVMSNSDKKSKYSFFEKKSDSHLFLSRELKFRGSYSVDFYTFIYFKIYFYLKTI